MLRSRVVPGRAVYKAPSKWTTIAAVIAALAAHALAVVVAGMQPDERSAELGSPLESMLEVTFEAAPATPEPPPLPEEEPEVQPPPAPVEHPEFVEERPTPPPTRPARSRSVTPIARPRVAGPAGNTASMSSAKAVALSAPRPEYPYEARRSRITGSGVVVMTVDPSTGAVTSAVMAESTGSPILDSAATSAFRKWRFKPGIVSRVRAPITFTMSGAQF